ncbi:hypothetical protein CsatB_018320 [Cannabis sativa]|uniref:Uncharacterized protein n=1 Tax=Cannabis sativa TaxID=3483 RepID=A0A803QXW4_CANSA
MQSSKLVETKDKLHQKFYQLQQEWLFYKHCRRTSKRYHHNHVHVDSTNNSKFMIKTLTLMETSPKNLMSSLQSGPNPSDVAMVKVIKSSSDSAVRDKIRERREAIKGGALKGRRRLFETGLGGGGGNDCWNSIGSNNVQESDHEEERSVLSFDEENDNCSVFVEKEKNKEGEKLNKGLVHEEKRANNVNKKRSLVAIMRCFALVSVIFAIFIIRSSGQNKVILVPT